MNSDTTQSPARCVQLIVLQRVAGKTYSTGSYTWSHGREVEWFPNGNYRRKLLGPCPRCGSVTSNYGSAFSCHNDYCPCSANIFACSPGPVPTWWETQVNAFKDGDAWCATLDGFVNLQESIAGFGESPQRAVEDLLQNDLSAGTAGAAAHAESTEDIKSPETHEREREAPAVDQPRIVRPCPFCGGEPVTGPSDPKKDGNAWGFVSCRNRDCPAQPTVRDGETIADERGSAAYIALAVNRWNHRPNE